MFSKRHYEYLADNIINDPDLSDAEREWFYITLGKWFIRDMDNFSSTFWKRKWKNRSQ